MMPFAEPLRAGASRSIILRAALPPASQLVPLGRGNRAIFALAKLHPAEHSHKERRLLKFPPQHVYSVVSNVAEYKEFVPWCIDSRVIKHDSPRYMEAELSVGFQFFSERYISRVTMEPESRVEAIAKNTQLFHYLKNEWTFAPGPNPETSTWLGFKVDFAFRSMLYAQATSLFFDEVVSKMVAAFENRCRVTFDRRIASAQRSAAVAAASAIAKLAPSHADNPIILTATNLEMAAARPLPARQGQIGINNSSGSGSGGGILFSSPPASASRPPSPSSVIAPTPVLGKDTISVVVPALAPHFSSSASSAASNDGFARQATEAVREGIMASAKQHAAQTSSPSTPTPSFSAPRAASLQWPSVASTPPSSPRPSPAASISMAASTDPYLLRLQQNKGGVAAGGKAGGGKGPRPAPPLPASRLSLW